MIVFALTTSVAPTFADRDRGSCDGI